MEIKRYVCLPLSKVVISEHFLFLMLVLQPKLHMKLQCALAGIRRPGSAWAQVFRWCKSASLEFPWLPPVGDLVHAFYGSRKILSKQTNIFLAPIRHGWVPPVGTLSRLTGRNPCTNTTAQQTRQCPSTT